MSGRVLNITNNSSIVTGDMLAAFISDLNDHLTGDFLEGWAISAIATIGGTDGYPVLLLDEPQAGDPSGALGYHEIDAHYKPYSRVFVKLSKQDGLPWSLPASHECLEMLVNSLLFNVAYIGSSNGIQGWLVYEEICDPIEQRSKQGKNGSSMSAFVLPQWYIPGYRGKVDNMGVLTRALQIDNGGYASADEVIRASGWQQFAMQGPQPQQFRRIQKRRIL